MFSMNLTVAEVLEQFTGTNKNLNLTRTILMPDINYFNFFFSI